MTAQRLSFKRITDDSFLDFCFDEVREIHAWWGRARGDRAFPTRDQFDPLAFPRHLPGISIVDVRPDGELVYRLVGTAEVALRGFDPTGRRVRDAFIGEDWEEVRDNYGHVTAHKACLFDYTEAESPFGVLVYDETLMMPLGPDGEVVTQILLYAKQNYARLE